MKTYNPNFFDGEFLVGIVMLAGIIAFLFAIHYYPTYNFPLWVPVIIVTSLILTSCVLFFITSRDEKRKLARDIASMPIIPGKTPLEVYTEDLNERLAAFNTYMSSPAGRAEFYSLIS